MFYNIFGDYFGQEFDKSNKFEQNTENIRITGIKIDFRRNITL